MPGRMRMHGLLMVVLVMLMRDVTGHPMHVRQAENRGQGFRHALQGHAHDGEREEKSEEPGSIHAAGSLRPDAIMSLQRWTESSFSCSDQILTVKNVPQHAGAALQECRKIVASHRSANRQDRAKGSRACTLAST